MIQNGFVALGPNLTGYAGGYPNGYLNFLKKKGWWGYRRLHLCSGSVHDGVTIDINPDVKPSILADIEIGVPLNDNSFDAIFVDPPYSEEYAKKLYGVPLLSVPKILKECARVVKYDGFVVLLDLRVWVPPEQLDWVALYALYTANRGPKPLRAIQVFRKKPAPLDSFIESELTEAPIVRIKESEK